MCRFRCLMFVVSALVGSLFMPLSQAALAEDAFTKMAVQMEGADAESVQGPQWVNCAKEGKNCAPGTDELVTVRYGIGEDFTYFVTQGLSQVPCKNFWGDPSRGKDKECAFIKKNLLGVADSSSFRRAANEGKDYVNYTRLRLWVRYGLGSTWVYTVVDPGQKMACTNGYFGFDPLRGTTKICQVGLDFTLGQKELTDCATEGRNCEVQGGDVVRIRYGTESRYDVRFVHREDGKIPCTNNYFGVDPIHKNKRCSYELVKPKDVETVGKWSKIISCTGRNCPITHSL